MPVVGTSAYNTVRDIANLVRAIMNDGGYPGLPLTIASIQRATNVVTITTSGPHGLILGDQAAIAGVSDASYNGTFTVASVVNSTQFTYAQAGANSTSTGGTSTGVGLGNVWTDAALIPFLNSAYRVVQRSLAMAGQTTFKVDEDFFVVSAVAVVDPSVQVVINEGTAPPNSLPSDLIQPLALWERPNLSSFAFVPMTDVTNSGGLPSINQTQSLGMWEWREDGLYFLGATGDVQVRMRYSKSLPILADGNSVIEIRNSQESVAFTTAAMAALSRGSTQVAQLDAAADDSLSKLIAASTRQQQRIVRRRRAFSSRRGHGAWQF